MFKCYQCMRDTLYLFDDARCNECTRLTEQDICGATPRMKTTKENTMTKKTCEVDGVTYEAAPQGEPGFASPCTGCAADASAMDVSHPLCAKLADCSRDDIIWVVQQ